MSIFTGRADAVFSNSSLSRLIRISEHSRLRAIRGLTEAQTRLFLRITAALDYNVADIMRIHQDLADAMLSGDADRAELPARDHDTPDGEKLVKCSSK